MRHIDTRRWRPSPAIVLAFVAVVLTTTGSATAARLITGKQIKDSSITGKDVKNRSLSSADLRGGGGITPTREARGPKVPMCSGDGPAECAVESSTAQCPPGTVVTGGGFDTGVRTFIGMARMSGNGYFVIAINTGSLDTYIEARAICAPGSEAPVLASRASSRRLEARQLARARAAFR